MPLFGSITSDINFSRFAEGQNYSSAVMVFAQSSAPTNWTKVTDYNDYALRVTTGNVTTGGNVSFSQMFSSNRNVSINLPPNLSSPTNFPILIGATTLSISQLPVHSHSFTSVSATSPVNSTSPLTSGSVRVFFSDLTSQSTGASLAHSHNSGETVWSSNPTNATLNFNVKYVDCILARFSGV